MGTHRQNKHSEERSLRRRWKGSRRPAASWVAWLLGSSMVLPVKAQEHTYTSDADFDRGTAIRVHHEIPDQLQLDSWEEGHPVVWIVKTGRKSIVRLDPDTGEILGEYRTAPDGRAGNPSRTAVDASGNVWVGNGSEAAGGFGSVVKIGLVLGGTRGHKNGDGQFTPDASGAYLAPPFLHCTAVDRDGDGLIRTSRGLGDVLPWPDLGDGDGGSTAEVQDAEDECVLLYQRTTATDVYHVSIAPDGRVWVGGFQSGPTGFDVLHPASGRILESLFPGCGGYGGAVDGAGVLWSASFNQGTVLRYDVTSAATTCTSLPSAAGVAIDAEGAAWCSLWDRNAIAKLTPQGELVSGFPKPTGGRNAFGVAIGHDGDVWVANRSTNDVSRLDAAGELQVKIPVGAAPMGIDVDARGKVWVVNRFSHDVLRIDPEAGEDAMGAVDLRVFLGSGAAPIAYGGMTGLVRLRQVASEGSWTVVHDGGREELPWQRVSWHGLEPGSSQLEVHVRSADAVESLPGEAWHATQNGTEIFAVQGRFLEVRVTFRADRDAPASPVLLDLRLDPQAEVNVAPECLTLTARPEMLWPPDGRMVPVEILGGTDADGDSLTVQITQILQDEPVGSGNGWLQERDDSQAGADASGAGAHVARLRAERQGRGNGRVYTLVCRVSDGRGGVCEGRVTVCVPHDQGRRSSCVDDGALFDSTQWRETLQADNFPNPFNPATTIRYTLTHPATVQLGIYDALGRHVRTLVAAETPAGNHSIRWNGRDDAGHALPSGVYLYRLRAGSQEVTHRMLLLK